MKPDQIGIDPEYFMEHAKKIEVDDKGNRLGKDYWIGADGTVYNQTDGNFLKPEPQYDKKGNIVCYRVSLTRSNGMSYHTRVHRLVAMAWVHLTDACIISYRNECFLNGKNPDCDDIRYKLEVHHDDEDPANNFYLNLRWKAPKQHRQLHSHRKKCGITAFIKANGRRYRNLVDDVNDRDEITDEEKV